MNKINKLTSNWLIHKINNQSLARHLRLLTGRVIDLGCGISPYRIDILQVAEEYIGVDWSNSYHDLSNVDVLINITGPLSLGNECADTVVSFQVMEHLPEPGFFLSECYRILRSGGKLFITVPFNWHVHEAPYDYFRYTRHGLEYLLQQAGFIDILIEENTGFWQMWILKFNYHTARLAWGPIKIFMIPIWFLGQVVSPVLDGIDRHPQETASYTVIAGKL